MTEEMITITRKEYESLKDAQDLLECLKGAGVDNWCGYDDAIEMYEESDS